MSVRATATRAVGCVWVTMTPLVLGNAATDMAGGHAGGTLQANGEVAAEHMMDAEHVGDTVAYVAGLPLDVTMLTVNIMYVDDSGTSTGNALTQTVHRATRMPFVGRG